jgi:hypothetical protein
MDLERSIAALNDRLAAGRACAPPPPRGTGPVVFIVGCARSGSTLLLQWLASSGAFCYPTNIISRFPSDPYVGALVQRVLHDFDHRGEVFTDRSRPIGFRSTLGRAQGATEPHDFGYFWRTRFAFGDTQAELMREPDDALLGSITADLRAMQAVFDRPLVMKAMQMNWRLDLLERIVPGCFFLHTDRDPLDNALSLLQARREFFGDDRQWYSFRPAEYARIAGLPPFEQALAQVHYTDRAVERQTAAMSPGRVMRVEYAELCHRPGALFQRIMDLIGMKAAYQGPDSFPFRTSEDRALREKAAAYLSTL